MADEEMNTALLREKAVLLKDLAHRIIDRVQQENNNSENKNAELLQQLESTHKELSSIKDSIKLLGGLMEGGIRHD